MDPKATQIAWHLRQNLVARGIEVQDILLFGSRARQTYRDDSDYDLLVISESFKEMDTWDRLMLLGEARSDIFDPLEILGQTPEEFESPGSYFYAEIKNTSVSLLKAA